MEKIKTNVFEELNNLLEQVKTIVKDNGGFLNTQNNDYSKDTMYAYVVNWVDVSSVEEQTIVCMRVVDDTLELGLCPNSINFTEGLVESDLADDDCMTLDRVVLSNDNTITLCCSGSWNNDFISIKELDIEVLIEIYEWLIANEDILFYIFGDIGEEY